MFGLISSFLIKRWFQVVLDGNSPQEYPANVGVPQGAILYFFYYALMTFLMMLSVILLLMAMILLSTLKYDHASDLWQQLELASELESRLRDTVGWGSKWLVDFNAGKTQLVSFDWSINTSASDVKIDVSVLRKNHLLRYWRLTFFSKFNWKLLYYLNC